MMKAKASMMSIVAALFLVVCLSSRGVVCDDVLNVRGIYGNLPPFVEFADIQVDLTAKTSQFFTTLNVSLVPNCIECRPIPIGTNPIYSPIQNLVFVAFQYTLDNQAGDLLWSIDLASNKYDFVNITNPDPSTYNINSLSLSNNNGSFPLYLYLTDRTTPYSKYVSIWDGVNPIFKKLVSIPSVVSDDYQSNFLVSSENSWFYFTNQNRESTSTLLIVNLDGKITQQLPLTSSKYPILTVYSLLEKGGILYGVFSASIITCSPSNNYTLNWFVGTIDINSGNVNSLVDFPSFACGDFLYPVISTVYNSTASVWSILLPLYESTTVFHFYQLSLITGDVLVNTTIPCYPIQNDYAYYEILTID